MAYTQPGSLAEILRLNHKYWLVFMLFILTAAAKGQNYYSARIPDSLKENAHAVIREFTTEFELQAVNRGTERVKYIITVLDKRGDIYSRLTVHYDNDSRVNIRQAILYDGNGQRVKKLGQSDISDIPAYDGASMYSDSRIKSYRPNYGEYPYTMEYAYEVTSTNLVSYGSWIPVEGYNVSVQQSKFTFIHPPDIKYKKKEINLNAESGIVNQGDKISEVWECNNFKAIEDEPYDISLKERTPRVSLMPGKLLYDNYSGQADTWKDYGKWVSDLYSGRDELTEPEKLKVSALLTNTTDTIQKIKLLYEYMQEHTRYIGIQLGIGGWQPFPAKTVFETGYGDCKALSNYMHALLKQTGIVSYPALVSAGRYIQPIYMDFPNFQQFNHVILCVPVKRDTIWLECTDQTIPFGFLGDFTDDRDVLLITDEGGKMVHTKKYSAGENLRSCHAEFTVNQEGEAVCSVSTIYSGLKYDDISNFLYLNTDEQKKWIYDVSSLPALQVKDYSIKNRKAIMPSATIEETLISKKYCSFTGNYMLLPLNLINSQPAIQKMIRERRSDFIINRPSVDYDTLVYVIPANFKIESVPAGKSMKSAYGDYSSSVRVDGNRIIYSRKFALNQGRYKASDYKSFYDFILSVSRADNDKVMLSKNSN
jgi:Domain of Unknown Function with PDB structure (DUF3857)